MINNKLIENYAYLIAKVGANVQKGEIVFINASLDQPDFVTLVVKNCYKLGAKKVVVNWHHDEVTKLSYKYETVSSIGNLLPFAVDKYKYMAKKLPTMIHIISDDPDAMKGVNQTKVGKAKVKMFSKIKKYRDLMEGKYKWTIAAVPSVKWAMKVFPNVSKEEAVEKLWNAILETSRVNEETTIENWNKHNEFLISQRKKLQDLKLHKLYYKSANGTDFEVTLIDDCLWGGGIESAPNKGLYNPNIPTEEVFTSPFYGKCEGKLVASKPLSYDGELIEDFSLTFKDGKVVEVYAKKNQKLLERMVKMDEGASMLGEVALVPYDSPIRNSNILFYETLFDENAACHVALGRGFREILPNSESLTNEECTKLGINNSMIHVDFMVGTKDLNIIGEDKQGKRTQIFKDGNWAI